MDARGAKIWFLGDRSDPWSCALLGTLRSIADVHALQCGEDVPERPFDVGAPPSVVVLHRPRLSLTDAARLERWRAAAVNEPQTERRPRLVLCYGPFVRYAEIERCGRAIDVLIPEATAAETLARHVRTLLGGEVGTRSGPVDPTALIAIISTEHALGTVLTEICEAAGFQVVRRARPEVEDAPQAGRALAEPSLTIWDVPVLEPEWPHGMSALCKTGPVIALLGFADRATVLQAREAGASACLEMPFQLDDLIYVIDRLATGGSGLITYRSEEAHTLPPSPSARARRGRAAIRDRATRSVDAEKKSDSE